MDSSLPRPNARPPAATFSPGAALGLLGAGVLTALLMGGLYGAMNFYSPLSHLSPFLLLAAGVGLGLSMLKLTRLLRVRSTWLALTCAGLAGVAAIYGAWVMWVFVFAGATPEMLLFSPQKLAIVAERLADSSLENGRDLPAAGGVLKAIWAAEALAWIALATGIVWLRLSRVPYSAAAGRWATERIELAPLAAVGTGERPALRAELAKGGVNANVALRKLKPLAAGARSFMVATGRTTNPPGADVFLTLEAVDFADNASGAGKARRMVLTRDLRVDVSAWTALAKVGARAAPARAAVPSPSADDAEAGAPPSFPGLGPAREPAGPKPRAAKPAASRPDRPVRPDRLDRPDRPDRPAAAGPAAARPIAATPAAPAPAESVPATFLKHDPDDTAPSPHGLPGMPPAA